MGEFGEEGLDALGELFFGDTWQNDIAGEEDLVGLADGDFDGGYNGARMFQDGLQGVEAFAAACFAWGSRQQGNRFILKEAGLFAAGRGSDEIDEEFEGGGGSAVIFRRGDN